MTQRARALTAVATATTVLGVLVPAGTASAAPDTEPPTGSFTLLSATSSDDPGPMVVEVVQSSLEDDVTDTRDIAREVDWGTGGGFEPWRRRESIEFSYTTVGRYHLRVRLTDRAGNAAAQDLGTVVVTDSFAPRIKVIKPASDQRRVWRDIRGYARDVGLAGLDFVRVKAVQKRQRGWFAYLGPERGWKLSVDRGSARASARPVRVAARANGAWVASLKGVRQGRLVVRSVARDREGNRSDVLVVRRSVVR
ncbi:MAG: PKD domain-containing protein [Nocardioides sp.]